MRQPIIISMRQRTTTFISRRIILHTFSLSIILFIMWISQLGSVITYLLFALFAISTYSIAVVSYYRVRTMPNFSIVIDEQGIHANKLFIPWDNIAAIYPVRVGMQRIEYVGVFPRNLGLMIRTSRMNPFLKASYYMMSIIAKVQGIPPVGLRPDAMSIQELLQQLWGNYYPEYQRYNISPYPPRQF